VETFAKKQDFGGNFLWKMNIWKIFNYVGLKKHVSQMFAHTFFGKHEVFLAFITTTLSIWNIWKIFNYVGLKKHVSQMFAHTFFWKT
jgi:hypothetical protein